MLGFIAVERGQLDNGEQLLRSSLEALSAGGDEWGRARPVNNLAEIARMRGDLATAEQLHGEALAITRGLGDLGSQPNILCGLGHVQRLPGEVQGARAVAREAIEISEQIGNRLGTASGLELLGLTHLEDRPAVAARLRLTGQAGQ
jgi:hypothetical protein